ncbi:methyltransferase domain-containing protein [uncultured Jatrophihabitans sp.]|uniref:methyltransferase domain-containing protein n=1 Tax=uncultured Jatrophihabitans sp. TaxID=1610747 RepID=UPI0035CB5BE3
MTACSLDSAALHIERWLAPTDAVDDAVLDRCTGPVLDVGCGPGRFVSALAFRGVVSLGVDISETAVALARSQGFPALLRSVFGALPGEGRWPTVLLMDGNIGIGGDPRRLLDRIGMLLQAGGEVIVEVTAQDDVDDVVDVCFTENGKPVGPSFAWSAVGLPALRRYAVAAGYGVGQTWSGGGRTFVVLTR